MILHTHGMFSQVRGCPGIHSCRDTEQMLQDEPLGCFLVRFSESTVGFVLSYR